METIGPGRAGAVDRIVADAIAWAAAQSAALDVSLATPGERLAGRPGAQLRVMTSGSGPDLLLHDLGRPTDSVEDLAGCLASDFTVHRLDLPSHGHSDPIDGEWSSDVAAVVIANAFGDDLPDRIAAVGWSETVASALAARNFGTRKLLIDPVLPTAERSRWREAMTAPIDPLAALWERIRDGRLYFPFCERNAGGRRAGEPNLDPISLHAGAADALLCGEAWPAIWTNALAARHDPSDPGIIIITHGAEAPHHQRFGELTRPWEEAVTSPLGN